GVQAGVRSSPPPVSHVVGSGLLQDQEGSEAVAEIVATYLQSNLLINEEATEEARADAAAEVEDVTVSFVAGEEIVTQGTRLTDLHIAAIAATSSPLTLERTSAGALAVVAVMVAAIGMYLS